MASEAARLAEALRAAKKAQSLSGTKIAEQIERLTGSRPSAMGMTRRLHGRVPLIRVSPELFALADILDLDVEQLVLDALLPAGTPLRGCAYEYWVTIEDAYQEELEFERKRIEFEHKRREVLDLDEEGK